MTTIMTVMTHRGIIYFVLMNSVIKTHVCEDKFQRQLYQLANEISAKYFKVFNCITHISDSPNLEMTVSVGHPVLLINLNGMTNPRLLLAQSYYQGCSGFVVQVHRSRRSHLIKDMITAYKHSTRYRYNNHRYLFLPTDEQDKDIDIIDTRDMFFLPNFLIVTFRDDHFSVFTHNFFCGHKYDALHIKHEIVSNWTSGFGFSTQLDLYPDKIRDLQGKKLIFSTMNYNPYSFVTKENNVTLFDGFETRLASLFVASVNGTWEGRDNSKELWGNFYENGTGSGIVNEIAEGVGDIGYAAIYQFESELIELSYPYAHVGVTCLVPRPQVVSGWYAITHPFSKITWTAIILMYWVSGFFLYFLMNLHNYMQGQKSSQKKMVMDAMFMSFRLQMVQMPGRWTQDNISVKAYSKVTVLYTFFVVACWQAALASVLTLPRHEKSINDALDLVLSYPKVQWGANYVGWIMPLQKAVQPIFIEIVRHFVVLDDEELKNRTRTKDFGFFVERLPSGNYGFNDYINEESLDHLKIMEKNIYEAKCVMLLPRGSPYLEKLDLLIIRMIDVGLIQKFEDQVVLEESNNRLQRKIKVSNEVPTKNVISLNISHIHGTLIIYCTGIVFSVMVFCIELCIYKFRAEK